MLIKLFISFLKIGLFSFGGGYAALALIQQEVVVENGWLALGEFNDLITISQMTPGPIALNSATFVGQRVAGFPGSLAATMGCILPSAIIVGALSYFYKKYKDLDTKAEEEKLRINAKSLEELIDPQLLAAFKRTRKSTHNGVAVAPIQRDACSGCFNLIPPQREIDVRSHKKIIACEYCGRVLIDEEKFHNT